MKHVWWMSPRLSWFLDAGNKEAPQAQLTGVQKAPRHEVAGSWAPAEQRALWRFNAAPGSMMGGMLTRFDLRVCPHGRSAECSGPCRRMSGGYQRAIYALMVLLGRERWPPAFSQRIGTGKQQRSEKVWLMRCRSCPVSAASLAGSRARTLR